MNPDDDSSCRITFLRDELKLSQNDFAKKIGITQGALSQLESGKSTLSLQTIRKISTEFNVDCNWLILEEKISKLHNTKRIQSESVKTVSALGLIPLVKEEAHAGYISQSHESNYIHSLDVYKIPGFEKGDYRMFEVEGESMLPTITPREIVITEHAKALEVENGTLCVVITDEGIVAKRLYKYKDDTTRLLFKSDNTEYKTYSMDVAKIKEVWEIKAKINHFENQTNTNHNQRIQSIEEEMEELKTQLNKMLEKK